jgi:hypothetical protein
MRPSKETTLKRKTRKTLTISADRAAHVLHILIAEGKLTAKHVSDALKRREELIHELRQRLEALERGAVSAIEKGGRRVARIERKAKRKMSSARRAALKSHGRYLGHIRTLPKAAKAKVKAIRKQSGVHAAIRAARAIAKPAAAGATAQRRAVRSNQPDYQSSRQRRLARYQQRERPKPDKHGGSGTGVQQGGSGAGRERG